MAVTLNKANLVLKDANGNIGKIEQLSNRDLAKIKTAVSDVALVVNQSNHTPIEATTTNKGVVQLATSADVVSGASDKVVTAEQLRNATTGTTSALATENLARIDAVVTEAGIPIDHTNTNQLKTAVTTLVNNAKTDASQKYLPLTGGVLTGNLSVGEILQENTNNGLYLLGGTEWDNGAILTLRGKDNATEKGGFDLGTSDGKSTVMLSGRANGALYWGTKHLVRSINGIDADVSGNVSITSVNHATSADSATNATNALKAQQDANGNNIVQTYATKDENINVLNQAKTDASQKYLPLTGGVLTGNLSVGEILQENTNNGLYLLGGTEWDNGAILTLRGKDNANEKGGFDLGASDGKSTVMLSGRANGALYWGTKHLVRSINGIDADVSGNVVLDQSIAISASGTNYIRFANGTQICWGSAVFNNISSANITLPVPFANNSYQVLCGDTGDGRLSFGAGGLTTTYFIVFLPITFLELRYIAIGSWK